MSILREISDAQLFFLVFSLLSLPVFWYFYLIAARETATRKQDSFSGQPAGEQPQTPNQFLNAIPAAHHSYNPSSEPQAAHVQENAANWQASGAADLVTSVRDVTEQQKELPARTMAHPPIARGIAILPWRHRPAIQELDAAAFYQETGYLVSGGLSFRIMVEVESLMNELGNESAIPADGGNSGSFVAEIAQGDKVGLFLECAPDTEAPAVDIDVAYQAFCLGSRPVTVIFAARSRPVEIAAKTKLTLRISSDSVELGAIDFEITVYPATGAAA